jgi:prepilin-type N-terminal cleavage/methylation domain-containing protein
MIRSTVEAGMQKQRGFTIMEVMITVAIIAILASIAIPQYGDFVIRGMLPEAHVGLGGYRVQLEQWYQDNRTYGTAGCGPALPPTKNFTFSCTTANAGQAYTAKATGAGKATGFTFTINEQNVRSTTLAPTGWDSPTMATCFIVRKGSC